MNRKQIAGLVIAAVVFVFVCAGNVLTEKASVAMFGEGRDLWQEIWEDVDEQVILPEENFVGVVRVIGTIQDAGSSSYWNPVSYDHQYTLRYIDAMINSEYNQGILLYVDSPGGTVYHSDELYLKLQNYKEITGRPVWTYMASQGCSGAYYISCASDYVGANRNCWTGSIGVIISYYNYSELLDKLGVEEIDITSGKNKAMGSSGKKLTPEQEEIMQGLVDEAYAQFVEIVAKGRDMTQSKVKKLADGRLFTASQAYSNGLIDEVSSYEEFTNEFCLQFPSGVMMYEPNDRTTDFWGSLLSKFGENQENSKTEMIQDIMDQKGNGVPLYYAELHK